MENPIGQNPNPQDINQTDQVRFFNVMPKGRASNDGFIEPKIETQISRQTPEAQSSDSAGSKKKYKFYIIMGLILLIGGPLGYFLIYKYGSKVDETDIVVVGPGDRVSPTPPPPASEPGFTTPKEWREKYFPGCTDPTSCGDEANPDRDGLSNLEEHSGRTDPNNPDSDQDGLADGDEVNVFGTDPLDSHTAKDELYSDLDYFRGGYSISTRLLMTPEQIKALTEKMKTFGLHQTTFKSLGEILKTLYNFSAVDSSVPPAPTPPDGLPNEVDSSPAAQQDRDTQRSNAIKNVEIALVKYYDDNKAYPLAEDFASMFVMIKPYWKVAINPVDPINQEPYVYIYEVNETGSDFVLSFYSELAKQAIKKTAADAQKDAAFQEAEIYDNQRQTDVERLRTALLLYSQDHIAGNQQFVFPAEDKYKAVLPPEYISEIPKDPKTGEDYEYKTSGTFDTFTIKAVLGNPAEGTTGWMCNQDECRDY